MCKGVSWTWNQDNSMKFRENQENKRLGLYIILDPENMR